MRRFALRMFLSLAIVGGMLYLALRSMSFDGMATALRRANWVVLLPYMAIMAGQHLLRVARWGLLLEPIHRVRFGRLLSASTIGFFAILALPLRLGELVRPYLIADPPHLRLSHALGTLAVERVFDGLVLSLVAFAAVATAKFGGQTAVPDWVYAAGVVALLIFLVATLVLVITLWQRERAVTLCRHLVGLVSTKLATRAAAIADGIVEGFKVLPDAKRLSRYVAATVTYWLLNAWATALLAHGFGIPLELWQAMAFTGLIGIGIMVPAGPGFIGNFELFAQGALALYLSPALLRTHGMAFVLSLHAANALWYVAAGLVATVATHANLGGVLRVSTGAAASNAETEATTAPPGGMERAS